ncbi:MAG: hypothetical protein A2992_07350 [Elusimicrobia bacterium RIFCSPLOWO2_01_FULL_59_12]|nr:MAG: hypothetical protein A2992_07350 [Elusimicrobia bacterium RIFCSPLOWO2_01_FULL_59_12]
MRVPLESRYLLPESLNQIKRFLMTEPILGSLLIAVIFGLTLGLLRRIFGRIGYEIILIAILISVIALVLSGAGYTLFTVKGFRFGG